MQIKIIKLNRTEKGHYLCQKDCQRTVKGQMHQHQDEQNVTIENYQDNDKQNKFMDRLSIKISYFDKYQCKFLF